MCAHVHVHTTNAAHHPSWLPARLLAPHLQAGILSGRVQQRVLNPYQHERAAQKLADDPNVLR